MARAIHRLSDRRARTAGPGMHPDGGGLYLQVGPTGSRSWIFRFATGEVAVSRNGKPRRVERAMGLGAFPDTSLAEARVKALDARKQRATGIDPLVAKHAVRAPQALVTFEASARDYIASHQNAWGAAYVRQWESSLATYAFPTMGNMPVAAVDIDAVFKVLSPIWHEKLETASRLRGQIEAILDAAKVRGLRNGDNPASWRGNLSHLLAKKSQVRRAGHHTAMPYSALAGFLAKLRVRDDAAARALEQSLQGICRIRVTRRRVCAIAQKRWATALPHSMVGTPVTGLSIGAVCLWKRARWNSLRTICGQMRRPHPRRRETHKGPLWRPFLCRTTMRGQGDHHDHE
jgi:hypothetical protein